VQIRDEVPREKLFSSYLWVSGTSQTARQHAVWLSERLRARHHASARPFLVELASNDGFFLQHYRDVGGFDVLGVDPSNLATEADRRGLPSIRDFFGRAVADRIRRGRGAADVIVARNVLGHASALQDLVCGVKELLAPSGVFVLEVPYAYFLRAEVQYDTIFHEHISYPTVGSVASLMRRFGMKIADVSFVQMNGGSMLCEIVHEDSSRPQGCQSMLDFEAIIELNTPAGWRRFAATVEAQRTAFVALLRGLAAERKKVVGYGAAAKFMTMLNYCGVSTDLIAAVGDANPRKQGLLCPGVRIPVVSSADLMAQHPDYVVIGAWNFKDEIVRLFRETLGYRNRFIVPLPMPAVEG
jgi:SAM-dependent methyltransferase